MQQIQYDYLYNCMLILMVTITSFKVHLMIMKMTYNLCEKILVQKGIKKKKHTNFIHLEIIIINNLMFSFFKSSHSPCSLRNIE